MVRADTDDKSLFKASKWETPCWAVCGRCDYIGYGACALTVSFPCVAQGLNRQAALGARCWFWTFMFLIVILPGVALGYGHAKKERCVRHFREHPHAVDQDGYVLELEHLCASVERFNLFAIAACIAAVVIGLVGYVLMGCINRMHIRTKYNLPGHCCSDFLLWLLCSPCALSQETRTVMKYELIDTLSPPAGSSSVGVPKRQRGPGSVEDLPL